MKSIFSVSRKAPMALVAALALFFMGGWAYAQTSIKGKVLDSAGEAIVGASVFVPGTTNGVISDIDGVFEIRVAPGTVLEAFCIGYTTTKVAAAQNMVITLQDDRLMLEEAVAVGYGTMRKSDITGAMVSVNAEQLVANPSNNAIEALQGKAAGVYITSNERPGQVGSIRIRGVNSTTNANNEPLIVIDGVISKAVGMDMLNPQDIQDIQVLKDASATAIYGAMGGNGVILVTTKRGTKDRLSLNYSATITAEKIYDTTPMMNAQDYIEWRRWGYYYAGKGPRADAPNLAADYGLFTEYGYDPTSWANILNGWGLTLDQFNAMTPEQRTAYNGTWNPSKVVSTDWTQYTDRIGISQEHSLSASGGTDKFNAYVSIGYLKNTGTNIGQDYQRYTVRTNVDVTPVKWFKMGGSLTGRYSVQEYGIDNGNGISGSIPNSLHAKARNSFAYALPYDADGNRIDYPGGDTTIPTVVDEVGKSAVTNLRYDISASFYAQLDFGQMWEPLKGLTFRSNFGPQLRIAQGYRYLSIESVNRISQGLDYVSSNASKNFGWVLDNTLNYNRTFGNHTIGVTLLQEAMANMSTTLYSMSGTGVALGWTQQWWGLSATSVETLNSPSYNSLTETQLASYMARVNYSFKDKYIATVTYRLDGASQLGVGHKWHGFPSVSLAWRMDKEPWMKNVTWVDQLKLRAGWGLTGNYSVGAYSTKDSLSSGIVVSGNDGTTSYFTPTSFANQTIGWETTQQYNIGVDFSVLKGRISGVLDLYQMYTDGLIFNVTLPAVSGYTGTKDNVGKTSNHGFDLTLNTININNRNFTWRSTLNLSFVKDTIVELQNGKEDMSGSGLFIGQPINVLYGFKSAGLWTDSPEDQAEMALFNANGHSFKPGMVRPVDISGPNGEPDHKIDNNYDRVIIGNTRPLWNFGFTNTFTWKNWEASIFIYGNFGFIAQTGQYQGGREPVIAMNYYNENNKTGDRMYQRPYFNTAGGDSYSGIRFQSDASYLKVRQISIAYNLPKKVVGQMGLSSVKVSCQLKNPFSIFQNAFWMDAEFGGTSFNRGLVFGLNIGF